MDSLLYPTGEAELGAPVSVSVNKFSLVPK